MTAPKCCPICACVSPDVYCPQCRRRGVIARTKQSDNRAIVIIAVIVLIIAALLLYDGTQQYTSSYIPVNLEVY